MTKIVGGLLYLSVWIAEIPGPGSESALQAGRLQCPCLKAPDPQSDPPSLSPLFLGH